jgi:3-oxoacyl-[acyl-carrier protein] reductase
MDLPKAGLDFSNRIALVVGGSSGIGNGIAQAFRAHGAAVHIWGTRPTAEAYANDPGSDLTGITYAQVNAADRTAVEAWPAPFEALDTLILCQGAVLYSRQEFQPEGWAHVMDVNLHSLMWVASRFRPLLAASRGALIIVSSVAGFRATRGNPAYSASKAGAVALTKTLGAAWITEGIRVNGIAPGLVDTKLTRVTTAHPKRLEGALAGIPAGRLGTPADMAGVALFLASDLAAYVVGQTIITDGGMTLA